MLRWLNETYLRRGKKVSTGPVLSVHSSVFLLSQGHSEKEPVTLVCCLRWMSPIIYLYYDECQHESCYLSWYFILSESHMPHLRGKTEEAVQTAKPSPETVWNRSSVGRGVPLGYFSTQTLL